MGETRVHDLARDMGVPVNEVLARASELAIEAPLASSILSGGEAEALRRAFEGQQHRASPPVRHTRRIAQVLPEPSESSHVLRRGITLPAALWRFRWVVLGAVLAGAAAGLALSFAPIGEDFKAETELFIADPSAVEQVGAVGQVAGNIRYQATQARFIQSTAVAERTIEIDGRELPLTDVSAAITATPSVNADTIVVAVTWDDPVIAADLANAVAEAYRQLVSEQLLAAANQTITDLEDAKRNLEDRLAVVEASLADDPDSTALLRDRDSVVTQLSSINDRIQRINVDLAFYGSGVRLVEPAEIPKNPEGPNPVQQTILGGIFGLLAAAAFAWAWSYRSPTAEDRHDPAPVLGAPLLGEIPEYERLGTSGPVPMIGEPDSLVAEAYEFVLSALGFALNGRPSATIVVTSAVPGEGKTSTALNLAAAVVADGRSTMLVDADERAQGLGKVVGTVENGRGLTDLAMDSEVALKDVLQEWKPDAATVIDFVPAGSKPPKTAGFFRSQGFSRAMGAIRGHADITLMDSPPVLAVAETADIAAQADGVLIVVEQGTPLKVLREMRERLEMTATPVFGYVFNKSIPVSPGSGYGYGRYAYGHGKYGKYGHRDD